MPDDCVLINRGDFAIIWGVTWLKSKLSVKHIRGRDVIDFGL